MERQPVRDLVSWVLEKYFQEEILPETVLDEGELLHGGRPEEVASHLHGADRGRLLEVDLVSPVLQLQVVLVETLGAEPGPARLTLGREDGDGPGPAAGLVRVSGTLLVTLPVLRQVQRGPHGAGVRPVLPHTLQAVAVRPLAADLELTTTERLTLWRRATLLPSS